MSKAADGGVLRWQVFAKVALFVLLIVAGNYLTHFITGLLDFDIRPSNEDAVHHTILIAATLYSLLLAIPFVPGAEIGIALMAMLGPPISLLVYACTIAGLTISYIIGRLIPLKMLIRFMLRLRLTRTASFLESLEPLDQTERLAVLVEKAPTRILPFLLQHRHLALALALNIPGNFVIGGGGGIAIFAGISRLYSLPAFLLTVALAVSPVPLAVFLVGKSVLSI